MDLKNIFSSQFHAYCLLCDGEKIKERVLECLSEEWGIPLFNNPDITYYESEVFTIDDSRFLENWQSNRSFSGGKRVCIIKSKQLTTEAQNALLKVFEDPKPDVHFILLIPSKERLLPTLLSRLRTYDIQEESEMSEFARKFLSSTPGDRMEILKDMIENKDKAGAEELLNECEKYLHAKTLSPSEVELSEHFLTLKGCLRDKGSSMKMILDFVASSLPTVNIDK